MICRACPRDCGIERSINQGYCGMKARPVVAKAFLHQWEEPVISGTRGSGTVFFSGCSLKCLFCQNEVISHSHYGKEISTKQLSMIFESLQEKGAHNINLVNPTHFAYAVKESLEMVKGRLEIPVIWNSSAYESVETIRDMNGYVDVYLPDLKYYSSRLSAMFSGVPDYFEKAGAAILEMFSQTGEPQYDKDGLIKKGLVIRHLILPNCTHDSLKVLEWIAASFGNKVLTSVMSQYTPNLKASGVKGLDRKISRKEYDLVKNKLADLGIENGFIQDLESADTRFIPDFNLEGIPD